MQDRIVDLEKQLGAVSQRLDQSNRLIAAIKGRDTDGAMNYQGEWGRTTGGSYIAYSGHWLFDFADGKVPEGWKTQGSVTIGPSVWPDPDPSGGYLHQPSANAVVLTAVAGQPASIEIPIGPDHRGALYLWFTYDDHGNEPDTGPDGQPWPQAFIFTNSTGGELNSIGSMKTEYYNYGTQTAQGPFFVAINHDRFYLEWRTIEHPFSLILSGLELSVAESDARAEYNLHKEPYDEQQQEIVESTTVGIEYAAGDVVNYNGTLYIALTDTDANPPVVGEQWRVVTGDTSTLYGGEWTP